MDISIPPEIIIPLATELVSKAFGAFSTQLSKSQPEKEQEEATKKIFERAFQIMLEDFFKNIGETYRDHVADLLREFVQLPEVSSILVTSAINDERLPLDDLAIAFESLDYDPTTIDFDQIMQSLAKGLEIALDEEDAKPESPFHGRITRTLLRQIREEIRGLKKVTISPRLQRNDLLTRIQVANAELRNYPSLIGGIHAIVRPEIEEMLTWLRDDPQTGQLAMLHDRPGVGKTVVMVEILKRLEAENIPVLAIKADSLLNLQDETQLTNRLNLPLSVDVCVKFLAARKRFVLLVDQN